MMVIRRGPASARRGIVLLWSVFAAMAIFATAFVLSTLASSSKRIADVNFGRSEAEHMSQGAVAFATAAIYDALEAQIDPPAQGVATVDGTNVTYTITQIGAAEEVTLESGLNEIVTTYRIEGRAEVDGVPAVTRQVVRGVVVPLFQFALFYNKTMDFLYPAQMTINGRVHCNEDMYVYSQSGLDFNTNHLTIAGHFYNRIRYEEWADKYDWGENETIRVRRYVDDPFDASEPFEYEDVECEDELDDLGVPSASGFDSSFAGYDKNGDGDFVDWKEMKPFGPRAQEQYSEPDFYTGSSGQTLRTGEHGVEPVQTPEIADFDMFVATAGGDYSWDAASKTYKAVAAGTGTHAKGPFYAQAGLSIIRFENGTWKAYDSLGLDVSADVTSAISTTTTYDARQAEGANKKISMVVIDMSKLNTSGRFPANGLLYVASYGAGTGTNVKGFQLTKGSKLNGNLSVVSPDSIYIKGDFNTTSKKSAAVMADAVNLLSNSWDNSKTWDTLPSASDTTYNVALLCGDGEEAGPYSYNGGPHNLPRFHEKWSSKKCTILGSMVCLGSSSKATGQFEVDGDYYKPPTRVWTYDTAFNSVANLPPFTPAYVEVENVVAW